MCDLGRKDLTLQCYNFLINQIKTALTGFGEGFFIARRKLSGLFVILSKAIIFNPWFFGVNREMGYPNRIALSL